MNWRESIVIGSALIAVFFVFFGGAFVSLCAYYDDRVNGPLERIRPYARFLCLSYLAMGADICLFFGLLLFTDLDEPIVEQPFILVWVLGLINWPFLALAWLGNAFHLEYDLDIPVVWYVLVIVLFFATGFFWGYIAERLLSLLARLRSRPVTQSPQIT